MMVRPERGRGRDGWVGEGLGWKDGRVSARMRGGSGRGGLGAVAMQGEVGKRVHCPGFLGYEIHTHIGGRFSDVLLWVSLLSCFFESVLC